MIKPDTQELQALARVFINEPKTIEFLKKEWREALNGLTDLVDDVAVRRAQGKAKYLAELLDLLAKAPELAARKG